MSCWHGNHEDACDLCDEKDDAFNRGYEAGMTKARQTWVGLTDEEIDELLMHTWGSASIAPRLASAFARVIEAKLKAKND